MCRGLVKFTLWGTRRGCILDGIVRVPKRQTPLRFPPGLFSLTRPPSRIAEIAKHQRLAEAIVIAPTPPDHGGICLAQCAVAHQLTPIGRWIAQRGDLGFGQLLSRSARPADPGQGVSMSVLHRMPNVQQTAALVRRRRAEPDTLSLADFPRPAPHRSQFVSLSTKLAVR